MQESEAHENDSHGSPRRSTHDRILDIALELFVEHGYDKTTLRDIAERLGTTKAALYYHFKSKSAILLELHMRLHSMAEQLLDRVEAQPDARTRQQALPHSLDDLVTVVDENLDLVQLHLRNQNALAELDESKEHQVANEHLQNRFQEILGISDLSPETRVRLTCAFGAILGGLMSEGLADDVPHNEKVKYVRSLVAELF